MGEVGPRLGVDGGQQRAASCVRVLDLGRRAGGGAALAAVHLAIGPKRATGPCAAEGGAGRRAGRAGGGAAGQHLGAADQSVAVWADGHEQLVDGPARRAAPLPLDHAIGALPEEVRREQSLGQQAPQVARRNEGGLPKKCRPQ
jgi:hypothetical protein